MVFFDLSGVCFDVGSFSSFFRLSVVFGFGFYFSYSYSIGLSIEVVFRFIFNRKSGRIGRSVCLWGVGGRGLLKLECYY